MKYVNPRIATLQRIHQLTKQCEYLVRDRADLYCGQDAVLRQYSIKEQMQRIEASTKIGLEIDVLLKEIEDLVRAAIKL